MLREIKLACISEATKLPYDYTKADIRTLADGYCEARQQGNAAMTNMYISALCLRFWSSIHKIKQKCKTLNWEYGECFSKLYEAIELACTNRVWQTTDITPSAAINKIIDTRVIRAGFYESNLQKNKANFNAVYLDAPVGDEDENQLTLVDLLESDNVYMAEWESSEAIRGVVQRVLEDNKVVEAIILDNIAYTDANKVTKKTVTETDETGKLVKRSIVEGQFWPFKIVQQLSRLTPEYATYFLNRYKVSSKELGVALNFIKTSSNQKLYKILDKTLEKTKQFICPALGVTD